MKRQTLQNSFLKRNWWMSAIAIWLCQMVMMMIFTPSYEMDTNAYITGGFTWDPLHPPLTNIFVAIVSKASSGLHFIIAAQAAIYAFAAGFFIRRLEVSAGMRRLALALAALEPVTAYYNLSLLSESLFLSCSLLCLSFILEYLSNKKWAFALAAGFFAGLAFTARYPGMMIFPVFPVILLLIRNTSIRPKIIAASAWTSAFLACFLFVLAGQQIINDAGLFEQKGRVKFDRVAHLYDPESYPDPAFEELVWNYYFIGGQKVENKFLLRERFNLGYKDCMDSLETGSMQSFVAANCICDSMFESMASRIASDHPVSPWIDLVSFNMKFLFSRNYLHPRYTPDLHIAVRPQEFTYLDSMMVTHFNYDLDAHQDEIPGIWKSMGWLNLYIPFLMIGWMTSLFWLLIRFRKRKSGLHQLVVAFFPAFLIFFHLFYVEYRLRFIAPVLLIMWMGLLALISELTKQHGRIS